MGFAKPGARCNPTTHIGYFPFWRMDLQRVNASFTMASEPP